MNEAANRIKARLDGSMPKLAFVLGSGLGSLVDAVEDAVRISYAELPGFPASGVTGHAGELVAGRLSGKPVLILSGRAHYYEHGNASAMRPVLETLKSLGIETLILTNAAGSVREDLAPGSVMLIDDHINYSGLNPLIGEPSDARFVGMTAAYDAGLKDAFEAAARKAGEALPRGVYMWFSGPSFETPAEIRMARVLGADAVGMSTVPEVILGRFLGLRIAACSVITNFGAGLTGNELSHQETKDMAPVGGKRLQKILEHFLAAY
ncbi:purine-nucleoside phosphorylase [Phyllobacterium phragmitis]|uniref:Purine nucleoside phosphorylase n=1 Tax=Phyllobacterium phragmitis TaxID=2670329 RepID=A0A2S9IS14_9HYPH|nr:purine-nucleoside phosphorylase [Phyllobacterium phragmitis]PRD43312.1 purine-nucleoside phosphorylase [Phyllobacterium phragmitis]